MIDLSSVNVMSMTVPVVSALGGIVFYHIRQSSRLSVLENDMHNLEEKILSLEARMSQDLRDLGQKIDRFIYALAGGNKRSEDL
jgi:hypothetical protein